MLLLWSALQVSQRRSLLGVFLSMQSFRLLKSRCDAAWVWWRGNIYFKIIFDICA